MRAFQPQLALVPKAEAPFEVTFKPVMTRREAEVLFEIDAAQATDNPAWSAYFVESLVEFLVYGSRPTGHISESDAAWLVASVGKEVSPNVPALVRALVLQAEEVPECVIRLAMRCGAMRGPGTKPF